MSHTFEGKRVRLALPNLLKMRIITQALLSLANLLCMSLVAGAADLHYEFNVKYISGSPDGVFKKKILSINGLFPGPTIEGQVGDVLHVTLINNIQDGQNTSIHWHGIHQRETMYQDGTSCISQCPLKNGHDQLYTFTLEQTGTYWYHAHVGSQYTEGLWGSLIIRNSTEAYAYDDEILITLNDWYHRSAHELEAWHLSIPSRGVPPYPDTGMINGRGRYPCDIALLRNFVCDPALQHRHVFHLSPGRKVRVRVINVSAYSAFRFSIDNHTLHTIEVDGVDVGPEPVPADVAVLAAAQRYSFLIETDQHFGDYLIRANMMTESLMLIQRENINPYPEKILPNVTAVLRYHIGAYDEEGDYSTEPHDYTAIIPPMPLLDPVLLDENRLTPHDGVLAPSYYDTQFVLNATFLEDEEGIRRGSFNFTPFQMPHKPLLLSLVQGEPLPESSFPLYIQYGDVVEVVINNPFFGPHPFHLHGHSFWVLGTGKIGDGPYVPGQHDLVLDGARRDTVLVQEESWGVIRFIADNPGVWTFHCHIDWHNLSGMAATFVEAADICQEDERFAIPAEAVRLCSLQGISI